MDIRTRSRNVINDSAPFEFTNPARRADKNLIKQVINGEEDDFPIGMFASADAGYR